MFPWAERNPASFVSMFLIVVDIDGLAAVGGGYSTDGGGVEIGYGLLQAVYFRRQKVALPPQNWHGSQAWDTACSMAVLH